MSSVRYRIWSILFSLLFSPLADYGQPQTGVVSDESGTLITVSRTNTEVILAVDSKITHEGDPLPAGLVHPHEEKKLVEIGQNGACAIEGFTGYNGLNISVSFYLEFWVKQHPKFELHDNFSEFVSVAGEAWNNAHYQAGHLPRGRRTGDPITMLICGDVVDGHPIILRGETFVAKDARAECRNTPLYKADIFYVGGLFNEVFLDKTLFDPSFAPPKESAAHASMIRAITADLRSDLRGMNAFRMWRTINENKANWPPRTNWTTTVVPREWTLNVARDATTSLFKSVEKYSSLVAPPNQIAIISKCGRARTQLESMLWPNTAATCVH